MRMLLDGEQVDNAMITAGWLILVFVSVDSMISSICILGRFNWPEIKVDATHELFLLDFHSCREEKYCYLD
jgi:hypothetical protein